MIYYKIVNFLKNVIVQAYLIFLNYLITQAAKRLIELQSFFSIITNQQFQIINFLIFLFQIILQILYHIVIWFNLLTGIFFNTKIVL